MNGLAKIAVVVFVAVGLSAAVQAQPAAEKPKFNVGDKWEFKQSAADGKSSTWSREIVEIPSAEQLRVRMGAGTSPISMAP